ncbi:hypothetical protein [Bacillus sp. CGMCC 1.16541]|uniref:hypothetical protein n=1 Tax=Bacillus sp. CGMCC 1.16541 TaxID=2185143 RepID=UPI000D73A9C8|nr:hypothetical protein [Bacillus sp. CGMCC 1.16541]
MNVYNYVNNNPVMFVDPDGESSISAMAKRIGNAFLYAIKKWLKIYFSPSSIEDGVIDGGLFFGE